LNVTIQRSDVKNRNDDSKCKAFRSGTDESGNYKDLETKKPRKEIVL